MATGFKFPWGAALGAVLAAGLVAVKCLVPPAEMVGAETLRSLGPYTAEDTAVPPQCRTATTPEADCTAAWDAHRRQFFGNDGPSQAESGSGKGERP
jgi:conjugative transfer region protein TrbK